MATPSKFDVEALPMGREHISSFVKSTAAFLNKSSGKLLEIGPQERSLVRESFTNFEVHTFDIVDTHKPNFVGDLTKKNEFIPDESYDCVVCMDVLEHTLQPFDAVKEVRRILKHEGYAVFSAPLNFRIHGPVPDCWRFTEHGWKVLLRDFDIVEMKILETPDRELFPVHYNILARCNKFKKTKDSDLSFRFI
jgi:SAM-dependent methyltransferase